MNSCVLVGNLTKDVELRQVNENTTCVMFTLAVARDFKNPDGSKMHSRVCSSSIFWEKYIFCIIAKVLYQKRRNSQLDAANLRLG
jgi:single-stranded DNA-binding protein